MFTFPVPEHSRGSFLSSTEQRQRQSELRGNRRSPGGVLPEPEDGAALRTHKLRSRHQQGGQVSTKTCQCERLINSKRD